MQAHDLSQRKQWPREESWLLPYLQATQLRTVLEIGPGNGFRLDFLLRAIPTSAIYLGFEPALSLAAEAEKRAQPWGARAQVAHCQPELPLPIASQSQDLLLTLDLLEYLRMDQLYMICAEARRVLRPGGIWLARTWTFGASRWGTWLAQKNRGGCRPLDLHHYISPEDWRVLSTTIQSEGWLSYQAVALERFS